MTFSSREDTWATYDYRSLFTVDYAEHYRAHCVYGQ